MSLFTIPDNFFPSLSSPFCHSFTSHPKVL